jgi:hypothetical protein
MKILKDGVKFRDESRSIVARFEPVYPGFMFGMFCYFALSV